MQSNSPLFLKPLPGFLAVSQCQLLIWSKDVLRISGFDAFGEVLKPTVGANSTSAKPDERLIHQDLDVSLVQLAGNLNIKGSGSQVKK